MPPERAVVWTLTCSCGWTHEAYSRPSAVKWKAWHREQHTSPGERVSESGHVVEIKKVQS